MRFSFTALRHRRVAALLLVCLALSACGPAVVHVSPSARTTAAPGAPTLLIRMDTANDERGVRNHVADYLSDGAVIRWSVAGSVCEPGQPCGTLESNTLTEPGLATLRALIARDADLLGQPGVFSERINPGTPAVGHGITTNTLVLARPDGRRYTVSFPSTRSPEAGAWAPDPTIERLNTLADALVDPATLVGASGLASPTWTTYQPVQMAVFVFFGNVDPQFVAEGLAPDIAKTGWLLSDAPDALGEAFDGPVGLKRCAFLPAADVLHAITSLPAAVGSKRAKGALAAGSTWHSGTLLWAAKGPTASFGLFVVAMLPEDASASCADVVAY